MQSSNTRKVVLVGAGMVGMSFAYAALNQAVCDELIIIDIDKKRVIGEVMDLNHGVAFASGRMKISAGEYSDCSDADIVVICAGVNQKPGESRLELLERNKEVFKSIVGPVVHSGFGGIFIVATNPVDIMTRVVYDLSGFNSARVFGTGTTLDTARLRYLLGEYFSVDPRNMHAYVMGEHGDSEFVPWSQAMLATKSVLDICESSGGKFCLRDLEEISKQVGGAAQKIIEAKKATYYGIGMSIVRIVKAVLAGENSILTVSAWLRGEYGQRDVYAGVPAMVSRGGIDRILELSLTKEELSKFANCCDILRSNYI